jgi:hypothetical protein
MRPVECRGSIQRACQHALSLARPVTTRHGPVCGTTGDASAGHAPTIHDDRRVVARCRRSRCPMRSSGDKNRRPDARPSNCDSPKHRSNTAGAARDEVAVGIAQRNGSRPLRRNERGLAEEITGEGIPRSVRRATVRQGGRPPSGVPSGRPRCVDAGTPVTRVVPTRLEQRPADESTPLGDQRAMSHGQFDATASATVASRGNGGLTEAARAPCCGSRPPAAATFAERTAGPITANPLVR